MANSKPTLTQRALVKHSWSQIQMKQNKEINVGIGFLGGVERETVKRIRG